MIENTVRNTRCPLCGAESIFRVGDIFYDRPVRYSTGEVELSHVPELWSCEACGSSFVQNAVPECTAAALYTQGSSSERWSGGLFPESKPENQIECMKRYLRKGRTVLDIGCNTGALLDYAKSLGGETTGVEYSQSSRVVLREKGHQAFSSMAEVKNRKFDVITAFDLVEHLYDVPGFFALCGELLADGGVLILLTGNIESRSARLCRHHWWYVRFPEHIVFPSKNYIAEHSGFLIREWIRTYASRNFQYSLLQSLRMLAFSAVRLHYNGLPSIGPDHVLAVLQRDDSVG